jgi:hypothetical protein
MVETAPADRASLIDLAGKRRVVLIDVLYLLLLILLYSVSLLSPLVGIVIGIVLMSWGGADETRRIGRICLILGIINIGLTLIVMTIMIAFGGLMSHLPSGFMSRLTAYGSRQTAYGLRLTAHGLRPSAICRLPSAVRRLPGARGL